MASKKITLIGLMLQKEKIHYMRMKSLWKEMDDYGSRYVAYPIMSIIITFCHYCFAGMHFLFESFLYFTNRKQFNLNLIKINDSIIRKYKLEFNLIRN